MQNITKKEHMKKLMNAKKRVVGTFDNVLWFTHTDSIFEKFSMLKVTFLTATN